MDKLQYCISVADNVLQQAKIPTPKSWAIKRSPTGYLYDLPHTNADLEIVLPKRTLALTPLRLTKTLIHEALHLWQRTVPTHFNRLYKEWGFKKVNQQAIFLPKGIHSRLAYNPDTDDYPYTFIYPTTEVPSKRWVLAVYLEPKAKAKTITNPTIKPVPVAIKLVKTTRGYDYAGIDKDFTLFKVFGRVNHPHEIFAHDTATTLIKRYSATSLPKEMTEPPTRKDWEQIVESPRTY